MISTRACGGSHDNMGCVTCVKLCADDCSNGPRDASVSELIEICDGFVFTGGRPNVHPEEYGEVATEAHGDFDRGRDAIALGIIRACVERGQPIFGICRGFKRWLWRWVNPAS